MQITIKVMSQKIRAIAAQAIHTALALEFEQIKQLAHSLKTPVNEENIQKADSETDRLLAALNVLSEQEREGGGYTADNLQYFRVLVEAAIEARDYCFQGWEDLFPQLLEMPEWKKLKPGN